MTPIETLLDWLGKNHYYISNDLLEKVEELKEIEKQQIINAFRSGWHGNKHKDWNCEFYLIKHINNNFKSK